MGKIYNATRRNTVVLRRPPRKLNQRQKIQVKRIIGYRQEIKQFPFFRSAENSQQTPVVTDISQITQGDTHTQRDGNQIELKKIRVKIHVAVADLTNAVRVSIIQWKGNTDVGAPLADDIFQDLANGIPLSSFQYDNYPGLFNVLFDRVFHVSTGGPGAVGVSKLITSKKFSKKIKFNLAATSGTNKIYLIHWSDSGATTHPTVSYFGTLYFADS